MGIERLLYIHVGCKVQVRVSGNREAVSFRLLDKWRYNDRGVVGR